jgi:tRNA-uridine 2-sulfurtransferase
MKNWINEDEIIGDCPWERDIEDARAVAEQIGIPFRVVNLMQEYRERVVTYLLEGIPRGLTPNPDVCATARSSSGCSASGRATTASPRSPPDITRSGCRGRFRAARCAVGGRGSQQGPVLLPRAPVAGAARRRAFSRSVTYRSRSCAGWREEAGLATADKKDSQGICFIGQVKMQDFLRHYVPDRPGPIVRAGDETVLGSHRGLHLYTLGQRKGIGIPSNTDHQAYVVVGKRAPTSALLVAFDGPEAPGLFRAEVDVHQLQWNAPAPAAACALEARVRYRDPRVPIQYSPTGDATARIRFATPQRALASGQIIAFYDGPRLLGGGVYA